MVSSPEINGICAVIVTYKPDAGFRDRATRIAKQVGGLVIVDNGSSPESTNLLTGLAGELNAELIRNAQNLGVAAALNQGVLLARESGYQWALTMDQDSLPREDMTERLIGVYNASLEREKLAVVGSDYPRNALRRASTGDNGNHPSWIERKAVITSGSLLSIGAFQLIGPFRDELFIDHVDTEYCLRARSKGFKIAAVCAPLMEHTIGAPSLHRLPWKQTVTGNQPPIRRYYMARNTIVLLRTYIRKETIYVFSLLWSLSKSILLMLLFESERVQKLRATAAGVRAGLSFELDG